MPRLRTTLAALALLLTTEAAAQGPTMSGKLDCAMWTNARTAKASESHERFLQGLLNGMALGSSIDFWKAKGDGITSDEVFLWMDNYCRQKPLSALAEGAVSLMNEQTNNAWNKKFGIQ